MNDSPSASPQPSGPFSESSTAPPAASFASSHEPQTARSETAPIESAPPLPTPDGNLRSRSVAPVDLSFGSGVGDYVPLQGKAKALLTLLGIGIALDAISMLSTLAQLSMLSRVAGGQGLSEAEANANDLRQGLIGMGQLAVFLVTAILFLMWMHRAHRNLKALGAEGLHFTSGWAVGYFFVPIYNVVRPFEAMAEIWKGSNPETTRGDGLAWKALPIPSLLRWWWGIYLFSGMLSWAMLRFSAASQEVESLIASSKLELVEVPVSIASALLAMAVVRDITSRQEARAQRLSAPEALSSGLPHAAPQ